MKRIPITADGESRLRDELQALKKQDRPRIIAAIAEARSHGDLSENAEYHAAREAQSFLEGRIAELESVLSHAQVIDPKRVSHEGRIVFGATVELFATDSEEEVTYQIVGEAEADIDQGRISITSPIARALIGREEGDEVEVHAPAGVRVYEILGIRYE
jgi:transcription elongation factor GreA